MTISAFHTKRLRQVLAQGIEQGKIKGQRASVQIDGDALDIRISDTGQLFLVVPFNSEGELLSIEVNNAVLTRWVKEGKEGKSLMRRINSNERNTAYNDLR